MKREREGGREREKKYNSMALFFDLKEKKSEGR
jgi:hypothetical protein